MVKRCAEGILLEGEARYAEAGQRYEEAWQLAGNALEKVTAAHYLARVQDTPGARLTWNQLALDHALQLPVEEVGAVLPSLYLNVGKSQEDTGNRSEAEKAYRLARQYMVYLGDDGYSQMIQRGIQGGFDRLRMNLPQG